MDLDDMTEKREVRRPMNAFLIFCKRHRSMVRERNPDLDNRSVTRILGDLWANLGKEEKAQYNALAKQYKDAFMKANPHYKWHSGEKVHPQCDTSSSSQQLQQQQHSRDHSTEAEGPSNVGGLDLLLLIGQQLGVNNRRLPSPPQSHSQHHGASAKLTAGHGSLLEFADVCMDSLNESQNSPHSSNESCTLEEQSANQEPCIVDLTTVQKQDQKEDRVGPKDPEQSCCSKTFVAKANETGISPVHHIISDTKPTLEPKGKCGKCDMSFDCQNSSEKCQVESNVMNCGRQMFNKIIDQLYSSDPAKRGHLPKYSSDHHCFHRNKKNCPMSNCVNPNECLIHPCISSVVSKVFKLEEEEEEEEEEEDEEKAAAGLENECCRNKIYTKSPDIMDCAEALSKTLVKREDRSSAMDSLQEFEQMGVGDSYCREGAVQATRKSKRRNRGQRYQELIIEGIIQPSKERLAAMKNVYSSNSGSIEEDMVTRELSSVIETPAKRIRKRTVSESEATTEENKKYKTGDFDLEAQIATLPACSMESLPRTGKRNSSTRSRLHTDSSKRNSIVSSTTVLKTNVLLSLPPHMKKSSAESSVLHLVGSQKRKARKHSITHLLPVTAAGLSLSSDRMKNVPAGDLRPKNDGRELEEKRKAEEAADKDGGKAESSEQICHRSVVGLSCASGGHSAVTKLMAASLETTPPTETSFKDSIVIPEHPSSPLVRAHTVAANPVFDGKFQSVAKNLADGDSLQKNCGRLSDIAQSARVTEAAFSSLSSLATVSKAPLNVLAEVATTEDELDHSISNASFSVAFVHS